jgi:DHA2 family multidrug resistance protein
VFAVSIPVGSGIAACYLNSGIRTIATGRRMELRKRPFRFDSIGLSLLVIVMVCWEVMPARTEWDWLTIRSGGVRALRRCIAPPA